MHYFIDGYNLLFYLFGNSFQDFKSLRERLVEELNIEIEFLALDVTIVFDSHLSPGEGSRSHYRHLEIVFTPEGITADDLIIKKIKKIKDPTKEVVVTNDRELAFRARDHLANTQGVEQFLNWLSRRYSNKKRGKPKPISFLKTSHRKDPAIVNAVPPPPLIHDQPIEPITPSAPTEGSLEYYLKKFESKHVEILEEEKAAKLARKLRNKANRKK